MKGIGTAITAVTIAGAIVYAQDVRTKGLGFNAPTVTSKSAVYNPAVGEIIYDSSDKKFYGYGQTGENSGQPVFDWVDLTSQGATSSVPAGTVAPFAGTQVPNGWLLADGSPQDGTQLSALYAAIGTTYGDGSGDADSDTNFNLPDLRGRTAVGRDNMGGTSANRITTAGSGIDGTTLNASGGAQTHTLSIAQIPAHTHLQDPHNHTQNAHNHAQNPHRHDSFGRSNSTAGTTNRFMMASGNGTAENLGSTTEPIGNATATNLEATATNNGATAVNQNAGGGAAHNITQPSIILNYIIKI